jgi:hypothetical protein
MRGQHAACQLVLVLSHGNLRGLGMIGIWRQDLFGRFYSTSGQLGLSAMFVGKT